MIEGKVIMKWPAQRLASGSKKSFGMYQEASELARSGADLIRLEVGRPWADTPLHIKEAAKAALDAGIVHYGDFRGTLGFRQALAAKLKSFNKLDVDDDEILITNGLTHASYAAFMAAIDPGDEVILLEPYYPQHIGKVEMAGGVVVSAPLDAADNFSIKRELIESRITPRTRMIVLVNPSNPTGRVYTRAELQVIADLALQYDLLVLSDEVYEFITYDGHQHLSIAALPGMRERTISCYAFTKAYSMDGWRIGYVVADKALMPALLSVTMNDVTHVNVFVQEGALAAVTGPQEPMLAMVAADQRKRDIVVEALNRIPGITCKAPQGAIYAFPDISATGMASADLARAILRDVHVVTEAGGFYGPAGDRHLRICFGSESHERLVEGMARLTAFFSKL
ncbi:pyridoxal phosphate-dependent aminotransferase [Brevundimonas diminuta]|uniref:pyridoxal phosphate-dependent aminotransferase n=1 Tax=Brevundimonas diminuta TaxID=293 RepID=UPI003209F9E8